MSDLVPAENGVWAAQPHARTPAGRRRDGRVGGWPARAGRSGSVIGSGSGLSGRALAMPSWGRCSWSNVANSPSAYRRCGVRAVPLPDEVPDGRPGVLQVRDEVAGGLRHPRRRWMRGDAEDPDAAAGGLDHRPMYIRAPVGVTVSMKSAASSAVVLPAQEGRPGRGRPVGRRIGPGLAQHLPHRGGRSRDLEGEQLAVHPPVAPAGVLPRQAQHHGADRSQGTGSAAPLGAGRCRVRPGDHVAVAREDRVGTDQQP
jgi:hypothetical protein